MDPRIQDHQDQCDAYKSGADEIKTLESIHSVERYVKNYIYPKIKFFSDSEEEYNQPDFVGEVGKKKKQTVTMCLNLLEFLGKSHYTVKQKVLWWVSYRRTIKTKLCRLRHADVRALQVEFVDGMDALIMYLLE